MKSLVIGGAGFIGSHLVEKLVETKRDVIVADDLSNGRLENLENVAGEITFLHGDVASYGLGIGPASVGEVYNLASNPRQISFRNPHRDMEVNLGITLRCLEFARETKAKVLFTSNTGIVSNPQRLPIDETFKPTPLTPYDAHKLTSEHMLTIYSKRYGVRSICIRFSSIYGPRQRVNHNLGWRPVIPEFCTKLLKGEAPTVDGDGTQTRDLLYVKDAVDGVIRAMESAVNDGSMFILGSNTETSVSELYHKISRILGVSIQPRFGPKKPDDIVRMRYSYAKANAAFKFQPKTSLDDGLRQTVDFLKNEPHN